MFLPYYLDIDSPEGDGNRSPPCAVIKAYLYLDIDSPEGDGNGLKNVIAF